MTTARACVISGFRSSLAGHCALVGYYAEISGNFLPIRKCVIPVVCVKLGNGM